MNIKSWLLISTLLATTSLAAQSSHRNLRMGDRAYIDQDYVSAEERYRNALEAENTAEGNHNLGNSLYQQGEFEEAAKRFEEAAALTEDKATRARAFHNLGNARFEQKDYESAIDAYEESLRNDPTDISAKTNLALARKRLEQQQQDGEGNGQGQGENQSQGEGEGNEDGEGGESQDQEGQQGSQMSQANPTSGSLSKSEAEQLLRRVGDAETQTRKRLTGEEMDGCQSEKEW